MRVKKILFSLIISGIVLVVMSVFFKISSDNYILKCDLLYENQSNVQIFYSNKKDAFNEYNSWLYNVEAQNNTDLKSEVQMDNQYVRIDLGDKKNHINISNLKIHLGIKSLDVLDEMIVAQNGIRNIKYINNQFQVDVEGEDPFLVFDLGTSLYELKDFENTINKGLALVYIIFSAVLFCIIWRNYRKIADDIKWLLDILKEWRRIKGLAINDFKMKYAASYLGTFWAFVQPVVTVTIYSVIFGLGFKSLPVEGVSFPLWLTVGIIPWFFFSEALLNATNSLLEYSYLVKKVVFEVKVLPMVKIASALFVHLFFVLVAIIMLVLSGGVITPYIVQVIYYTFCTLILALGISYITSATVVFFKDLGQIVGIILQFGMWATPIMYEASILGPMAEKILKLNPIFYVVDGYRDALFQKVWFWQKPKLGILFWVISIIILYVGIKIFRGLEKHFADVL